MQTLLPTYLESSLSAFTRNQDQLREQMARAFQGDALGVSRSRRAATWRCSPRRCACGCRSPAGNAAAPGNSTASGNSNLAQKKPAGREDEIEALRRQLAEMQKTIETIAKRD